MTWAKGSGECGLTELEREIHNADMGRRCRECLKPEKNCVCEICTVCWSAGDYRCYTNHGLKPSHAVAVARQEWLVETVRTQLEMEEEYLKSIKDDPSVVYGG